MGAALESAGLGHGEDDSALHQGFVAPFRPGEPHAALEVELRGGWHRENLEGAGSRRRGQPSTARANAPTSGPASTIARPSGDQMAERPAAGA